MELKTKIHAEEGKQNIIITRTFDLPLELLFTAYVEPDIVEQWMGTKVLRLENKMHGGYQFETRDEQGNIVFQAHGVIHDLVSNQKIIRTFEMANAPFGCQLEFLQFDKLSDDSSILNMEIVFRSAALRDQMLQLPFAQGLNMAHNRLQNIFQKLNK